MDQDDLRCQAVNLAHWAARDYQNGVLSDDTLFRVLRDLSRLHGTQVPLTLLVGQKEGSGSNLATRLVPPEVAAHMAVTSIKRKRDEELDMQAVASMKRNEDEDLEMWAVLEGLC